MEKEKVKVLRLEKTTYEDGTVWVYYKVGEKFGYMISDKIKVDDDINKLEESLNELVQDQLVNKPLHEDYPDPIKGIILECLQSENEMWFVEYEDLENDYDIPENLHDEYLDKLDESIKELGLSEYIITREDGIAITVYGGAITMCLF